MNPNEGLTLFDKVVIAAVVAVIILLFWNLALRPVEASPADPICYRYRGKVVTVWCFRDFCCGWAEAQVTTFTTISDWVTGSALYRGKRVWIEVCR